MIGATGMFIEAERVEEWLKLGNDLALGKTPGKPKHASHVGIVSKAKGCTATQAKRRPRTQAALRRSAPTYER